MSENKCTENGCNGTLTVKAVNYRFGENLKDSFSGLYCESCGRLYYTPSDTMFIDGMKAFVSLEELKNVELAMKKEF